MPHDSTRPSPSIYDVKICTQNQVKSKKKVHHVRRSPNFDSNSDTEQKKGQNDNALILGRVSINTWTRLGTSLIET